MHFAPNLAEKFLAVLTLPNGHALAGSSHFSPQIAAALRDPENRGERVVTPVPQNRASRRFYFLPLALEFPSEEEPLLPEFPLLLDVLPEPLAPLLLLDGIEMPFSLARISI